MAFGSRNRPAGVRPSMGSVGDAWHNALSEIFFATLELELLGREHFRTPAEARPAVLDFVGGCDNPRPRHSVLEHLSPMAYEKRELPLA